MRNNIRPCCQGEKWLQVGPPYIMHREDMETVAPLWYHFTREVRNDPEASAFFLSNSPAPEILIGEEL